jgi:hypothetical protein
VNLHSPVLALAFIVVIPEGDLLFALAAVTHASEL